MASVIACAHKLTGDVRLGPVPFRITSCWDPHERFPAGRCDLRCVERVPWELGLWVQLWNTETSGAMHRPLQTSAEHFQEESYARAVCCRFGGRPFVVSAFSGMSSVACCPFALVEEPELDTRGSVDSTMDLIVLKTYIYVQWTDRCTIMRARTEAVHASTESSVRSILREK
jgi:hypothetical protein